MKTNGEDVAEFVNLQKNRVGIERLLHAAKYSWRGMKDAWQEPAFRLEVIVFIFSLPLALLIGDGVIEKLILLSSVWLLMIVEITNSAIESAIDRIGLEEHELSRKAKDLGSAAVFMAIALSGTTWVVIGAKNLLVG